MLIFVDFNRRSPVEGELTESCSHGVIGIEACFVHIREVGVGHHDELIEGNRSDSARDRYGQRSVLRI